MTTAWLEDLAARLEDAGDYSAELLGAEAARTLAQAAAIVGRLARAEQAEGLGAAS